MDRLGVKDLAGSYNNGDVDSADSLEEYGHKAAIDLEVIGLDGIPDEMQRPEDVRLFMHKKKNDYLRQLLD